MLVGEMLLDKMQRTDAYGRAQRDWLTKDRNWKSDGSAYPARGDLYDRRGYGDRSEQGA